MSILDYVPEGYTLREVQRKTLLDIEAAWNNYDVIVIPGPVGFGKSLVGLTVAIWQKAKNHKTGILTPQVLLQSPYANTPPYFPALKGRSHYECQSGQDPQTTCEMFHNSNKRYCVQCTYTEARNTAMASPVAIFNFHSYLFNRAYREILFIDEAHNLMSMLTNHYTLKIWHHKTPYPHFNNKEEVALWIEGLIKELKTKWSKIDAKSDLSKLLKEKQRIDKRL